MDNEITDPIPGGAKQGRAEKASIAMRNHSEAERRRRERINGHLATLRSLVPGTNKMDKAALLAQVISHVKELRRGVAEATTGALLIPSDADEIVVEKQHRVSSSSRSSFSIRASICCDFKHELLADLREAVEALPLKIERAEIATLGSRMVNVFVVSNEGEDDEDTVELHVDSLRQALQSVLDKLYASEDFNSTGKRRRLSMFSPSCSLGEIW